MPARQRVKQYDYHLGNIDPFLMNEVFQNALVARRWHSARTAYRSVTKGAGLTTSDAPAMSVFPVGDGISLPASTRTSLTTFGTIYDVQRRKGSRSRRRLMVKAITAQVNIVRASLARGGGGRGGEGRGGGACRGDDKPLHVCRAP